MTKKNIESLPVVNGEDHGLIIGMLTRRAVISFYNQRLLNIKNMT